MQIPKLIVIEAKDGVPVRGTCSSCQDITFDVGFTSQSLEAHIDALKALFNRHLEAVHSNCSSVS